MQIQAASSAVEVAVYEQRLCMDKYIKGEVLGEGTFGVVFKATHKEVCQEHSRLQIKPLSPGHSAPATPLLSCL